MRDFRDLFDPDLWFSSFYLYYGCLDPSWHFHTAKLPPFQEDIKDIFKQSKKKEASVLNTYIIKRSIVKYILPIY